jgi:hypothetical protein
VSGYELSSKVQSGAEVCACGSELTPVSIGLRRLRAAMSLFSALVNDPQTAAIKTELKWLTDALEGELSWQLVHEFARKAKPCVHSRAKTTMRLIAAWNERQADADVVLADNRRGRRCWVLLVQVTLFETMTRRTISTACSRAGTTAHMIVYSFGASRPIS